MQAKDGNFYGTTNNGGTGGKDGKGTVFRIDLSGNLTTLHSFGGAPSDGGFPYAGLIQASDGNLYGTTTSGGSSNSGTVFKVDLTGSLTTLHSFTDSGVNSAAGLMQRPTGTSTARPFAAPARPTTARFSGWIPRVI